MKSILVTGATGFVGSHILAALQSMPVKIIAACRDRAQLPGDFQGEVRTGDLRNPGYVADLVAESDVVCHAAAWTSLWGHASHSRQLYLEPTLALLDACLRQGVSRFVFISTTSAAAPLKSKDASHPGIDRAFWPHLNSVIAIENTMREHAQNMSMVNLRCGLFAGTHYGLGILPILTPRLKTHLVPWVAGGRTSMPIIDGDDIGRAFALAATHPTLSGYEAFNIVGPKIPTAREVIQFLHDEFGFPTPHFSVPFPAAYAFAWLMEKLDPIVPWEPLVTRSIVHLLEEVAVSNEAATRRLGYRPQVHWADAIRKQMAEMAMKQKSNMKMARPLPKTSGA